MDTSTPATSTPAWLPADKPYYEQPPVQRVDCGPGYGSQSMAESFMQSWLANCLSNPPSFVWGGNGTGDQTPQSLVDQVIAMALFLKQGPPKQVSDLTAAGFEPISRAIYYANQLFDTLKRIPAQVANVYAPDKSIFDLWTKGKP